VTSVVPFLKVRDAEAAAAWYTRLGFQEEWRHRFGDEFPLFLAVCNDHARIFLSEHEGDARPNTLLYLYVDDVDAVAREFVAEVEDTDYGMREVELTDPDGNRLRIGQSSS
jgi:catechol 2,3-dioxygenase-like lactoylglutathione lyase family enzyme